MKSNLGDPAMIMKYINPNEAKLIDSASGIHIKFRLAGVFIHFYSFLCLTPFNFGITWFFSNNFHQLFIIKYLLIDLYK